MRLLISVLLVLSMILISCGEKEQPKESLNQKTEENSTTVKMHQTIVEEKIDASNYTYLKVKEGDKSFWIAVSKMTIEPGARLIFSNYMEMKNFKSESLNRTFESILFVNDPVTGDKNQTINSPHSGIGSEKDATIKIQPPKDGYTIEQVYSKKSSLANKMIKVSGKVVKVNNEIMNTNWVHIQDGTGSNGTHDLLVTTDQIVEIGSVITAEGKVVVDKDFGAGYFYPVLLENCKIMSK